ncbi:class I SAM-dependent methyltransferase [Methanococcoides sp. LMO-2]|uniref:Class I SAM-dependent methyltransferase n=1 Tax=Methanococcoides cohabitans TaxID=3136559 RepID=A0ABU9KW65_9EURY
MNIRDIDWNEVWKEQMRLYNEIDGSSEKVDIWGTKESARRYWEMSRNKGAARVEQTLKEIELTPDSRVLDIGAGPGALAIPISERVREVVAVEPSEGMFSVLEENIDSMNIDNIRCIHKGWEEIDLEEVGDDFDVVIASYSLSVPDIRQAFEKIQAVSSGHVYVYWFAGETSWDDQYSAIWPALHNQEYHSSPKCNIMYNVLYDMGIYPNMNVFPLERSMTFSSLEDAVKHYIPHYRAYTPEKLQILREYLETILPQNEDGSILHLGETTRVRMWWDNSKK